MRSLLAILLLSIVSIPPAAAEESPMRQTIVLVPSVRHGHSTMWKTGAIITVASVGVSLLGAAFVVKSLHGDITESSGHIDSGLWISGLVISAVGDGGLLLGGPLTWIAGIHRDPDAAP